MSFPGTGAGPAAGPPTRDSPRRLLPADIVRQELLNDHPSVRVRRLWLRGDADPVICKEPLGPGSTQRIRHEQGVLKCLDGVKGVARLAPVVTSEAVVLMDDGGTDLRARMASQGPFAAAEAVGLGLHLAEILIDVHRRGVIHADINPSNVLLTCSEAGRPVLIDFDLARRLDGSDGSESDGVPQARREALVGTLSYMAPEQTGRTSRPVDHRADLYAIGALLHELILGQPAFAGSDELQLIHDVLVCRPPSLADVCPGTPAALSQIVDKLLAKEPDWRYQSAEGLAHDLRQLTVDGSGSAVELGRFDFGPRLQAGPQLIGRQSHAAVLEQALISSRSGQRHGLLLAGEAGAGKSALVDHLRTLAAGQGTWCVTVHTERSPQTGHRTVAAQIVRRLGRLMLAEPPAQLEDARLRLRAVLGPNAGLLAGVSPELSAVLEVEPIESTSAEGVIELRERMRQNFIDLVRTLGASRQGLLLIVEDLQWSTDGAATLLDALFKGSPVKGLLVVVTYRESELIPAAEMQRTVAGWRDLPTVGEALAVDNLSEHESGQLVAALLRLPVARPTVLQGLVHRRSGGNPQQIVDLLNVLRRDEVLRLSEAGWTWSEARLHAHPGLGDPVEAVMMRLARIPGASRDLLGTLACYGREAEVAELAQIAGLDHGHVRDLLAAPEREGLVRLSGVVAFSDALTYDSFLANLDSQERTARHLAIARRLALLPERRLEAAGQYLCVDDEHLEPVELRTKGELLEAAGQHAARVGRYQDASRLLALALNIHQLLGAAPDGPDLVPLRILLHAMHHAQAEHEAGDRLWSVILENTHDLMQLASATAVQINGLVHRGKARQGLELGLQMIDHFGIVTVPTDFVTGTDERLAAIEAWGRSGLDLETDLRHAELVDERVAATVKVLNRVMTAGHMSGRYDVADWIVLECQRLWVERGPGPALAPIVGNFGLALGPRLSDPVIGYRIGQHFLKYLEATHSEPETSIMRHRFALGTQAWAEPLENVAATAMRAHESLIRNGEIPFAATSLHTQLYAQFDSVRSLETFRDQLEGAALFLNQVDSRIMRPLVQVYRDLLAFLVEGTAMPADLDPALDTAPMGAVVHIYHALAAAFSDEDIELQRRLERVAVSEAGLRGYPIALLAALRALSLAGRLRQGGEDARPLREQLIAQRDWLAARSIAAPDNFGLLLALVDAETAWSIAGFREAVTAFDAAGERAGRYRRPWQRALLAQRASAFYTAHGLSNAARDWKARARAEYADWGATSKVAELAGDGYGRREGVSHERSAAMNADTVDMMAILRACQALSEQHSLGALTGTIIEQVQALTGAPQVLILTRRAEDQQWYLMNVAEAPGRPYLELDEASHRSLLPISVFLYVERSREYLLVGDARQDERLSADPYFAAMSQCSVLAVPLLHEGHLEATLILTSPDARGVFRADRLAAVSLIAGQLVVSLRNAALYDSLERKVAERTQALTAANQNLELLSSTDALTGLANRRRFEEVLAAEQERVRREDGRLSLLMIDVDFFKKYNDQYGHQAGDECLRAVAGAMQQSMRNASDLLARYGGEEFVVLLPRAEADDAAGVAERLCHAVRALALPHQRSDWGVVTVSIGVATAGPSGLATLIASADTALYRAKATGRNTSAEHRR